eukprot:gene38271-61732_t
MWVNVEIKNDPTEPDFDPTDSIADETMDLLLARGEPERWLISSFRIETVDRCRTIADAAGAPIRTAWLTSIVPDDVVEVLTARGHVALHPWVKLLRREVIMALMCQGRVEFTTIEREYGVRMRECFAEELRRMRPLQEQGLVDVETGAIQVTPLGWYFVRAIAMVFDRYLQVEAQRDRY